MNGGVWSPRSQPTDWGPAPKWRERQYWLLSSPPSDEGAAAAVSADRPEGLANLEAVLFLAREPLGTRKLAQLAGLADGTEARTLIRRLNRLYDEAGAAFRVEEVAGGVQLLTRERFAPWLRRLQSGPVEVRLSPPMLETLAVVAYRQPVLRAEVEAIRGVQCGEILRQLMERDLVRIVGRSEELGRPFQYGTTKRFLQIFGLGHLEDLPQSDKLGATVSVAGVSSDSGSAGPATDKGILSSPDDHSQLEEAKVRVVTNRKKAATLPHKTDAAGFDRLDDEAIVGHVIAAADEEEDDLEDDDDDDEDDDEDDEFDDDEDDEEDDEEEVEDDDDFDDDWEEVSDEDEEEEEEDDDWDDDDDDWDDDDDEDDDDEDEDEDWEDDEK